jgi:leader peptidase (prepilin peptidase)/N-methyltransferase
VIEPLAVVLALAGAAWGYVADRIGARWPEHDDGSVRAVDWRTVVVIGVGAAAQYAIGLRFAAPFPLLWFVLFGAALTVLLATDLDQRLLPDEITLRLIPFAAAVTFLGLNPLVPTAEYLPAIGAAILFPLALYVLSIPFGAGAVGVGDLKLMVSVGLLSGFYRAFVGLVYGALLLGLVVVILLVTRRVGMKSFIPMGPFLIIGALWGMLRV